MCFVKHDNRRGFVVLVCSHVQSRLIPVRVYLSEQMASSTTAAVISRRDRSASPLPSRGSSSNVRERDGDDDDDHKECHCSKCEVGLEKIFRPRPDNMMCRARYDRRIRKACKKLERLADIDAEIRNINARRKALETSFDRYMTTKLCPISMPHANNCCSVVEVTCLAPDGKQTWSTNAHGVVKHVTASETSGSAVAASASVTFFDVVSARDLTLPMSDCRFACSISARLRRALTQNVSDSDSQTDSDVVCERLRAPPPRDLCGSFAPPIVLSPGFTSLPVVDSVPFPLLPPLGSAMTID